MTFDLVHTITLVGSLLTTSFHSAAGFDISDGEEERQALLFLKETPRHHTHVVQEVSIYMRLG